MTRMKYCGNCERWVTPTKGVQWMIAMILLIPIIPGILYILWASSRGGKCPMCNSENWSVDPKLSNE